MDRAAPDGAKQPPVAGGADGLEHGVREANLVHGVFALATLAATRAELQLHRLLGDLFQAQL